MPSVNAAMTTLRERKKQRTRMAIAKAAVELCAARGYETVTMADVAAAADVGERTAFRYFHDKAELLFAEDAAVHEALDDALAARPPHEPPAVAIREALASLASRWQGRHTEGRTRQAIIDATPALKAREGIKHLEYQRTLAAGLCGRGTHAAPARLLAGVAVACFHEATSRWLVDEDSTRPGLEARIRDTFAELHLLLDLEAPSDGP